MHCQICIFIYLSAADKLLEWFSSPDAAAEQSDQIISSYWSEILCPAGGFKVFFFSLCSVSGLQDGSQKVQQGRHFAADARKYFWGTSRKHYILVTEYFKTPLPPLITLTPPISIVIGAFWSPCEERSCGWLRAAFTSAAH